MLDDTQEGRQHESLLGVAMLRDERPDIDGELEQRSGDRRAVVGERVDGLCVVCAQCRALLCKLVQPPQEFSVQRSDRASAFACSTDRVSPTHLDWTLVD